jgi:hypothetical protein
LPGCASSSRRLSSPGGTLPEVKRFKKLVLGAPNFSIG